MIFKFLQIFVWSLILILKNPPYLSSFTVKCEMRKEFQYSVTRSACYAGSGQGYA